LRAILAARDDRPLPETVEGLLRNVERGARALRARRRRCRSNAPSKMLPPVLQAARLCMARRRAEAPQFPAPICEGRAARPG